MLWTPRAPPTRREGEESPRAGNTGADKVLTGRQGNWFRKLVQEDMADSREVMNIRQASQYLGVSPDTLYKYVGEQRIPAFKLGNRWRFKKSRLDQWMEEKSSQMEMGTKHKAKAAAKAAAGSQ